METLFAMIADGVRLQEPEGLPHVGAVLGSEEGLQATKAAWIATQSTRNKAPEERHLS
jgi:hypothetical protein